jgi:hypothetical protein
MAFLTDTPNPFMIRTSSRLCQVYRISGDFLRTQPGVVRALWKWVAQEMSEPILHGQSPWQDWTPRGLRREISKWCVSQPAGKAGRLQDVAVPVHFRRPVVLLAGTATQPEHEHLDDDVDEDHDFEGEKSIAYQSPAVMRSQDSSLPNAHYIAWIMPGSRIFGPTNAIVAVINSAAEMKKAHVTRAQSTRMCKRAEDDSTLSNGRAMARSMMTLMTCESTSTSNEGALQIEQTLADMRKAHRMAHEYHSHSAHGNLDTIPETNDEEIETLTTKAKSRRLRRWQGAIDDVRGRTMVAKIKNAHSASVAPAPEGASHSSSGTIGGLRNPDWVVEEVAEDEPAGFL